MKNNKRYFILLFLGVLFLAGCEYTFVQYPDANVDPPTPDPENPISFADKIIPIFTNGNYCTACHDTGKTAPDLSAANAYNSIVSMNLVNLTDPAASKLYEYILVSTSTHPQKYYASSQAEKILLWIQEGALNN